MSYNLIIDIILVVTFILFVVLGIKRGFIKSALGIFGSIISIIVSAFLSKGLAEFIYDKFISQRIVSSVIESLIVGDKNIINKLQTLINMFPKYIEGTLKGFGYSVEDFSSFLNNGTIKAADAVNIVVKPIITSIVQVIVFLLLLIIFKIIIYIIIQSTKIATKAPVLHQTDVIFGGIFGMLQFIIFIFIISMVITFVTSALQSDTKTYIQELIDKTYIYKYLYNNNPINFIL